MIAHTLVLGGVRFDVGPVHTHHAHTHQSHLPPQAQNLYKGFLNDLPILA
jgi:hypothetical protein